MLLVKKRKDDSFAEGHKNTERYPKRYFFAFGKVSLYQKSPAKKRVVGPGC